MAKRMTLDETWKDCLSMWRWIAGQVKEDAGFDVSTLKIEWLDKKGIKEDEIKNDCFFCDYHFNHRTPESQFKKNCRGCAGCPGCRVDPEFDCQHRDYIYCRRPIAFYNKLVSLNRKRLAKKGS